jgi:DNA-directed RNA polymerase specialized sigma24 family protein
VNDADAEDIAEAVFLAFYERIQSVPPAEPVGWLLVAARKKAANWRSRLFHSRELLTANENLEKLTPDPAPLQDERLASAEARELARRLRPELRDAVRLYEDGQPWPQIATSLGLSKAGVYVRLHSAARTLDRLINTEPGRQSHGRTATDQGSFRP